MKNTGNSTPETQATQLKPGQKLSTRTDPKRKTHAQQTRENSSMSLIVNEMQTKPTMRYWLKPVRIAILNTSINYKSW